MLVSLQLEARRRGLSVNALVTSILWEFNDWNRFADRFRFVALGNDLIEAMLSNISDEQIVRIAQASENRVIEEGMMFWRRESGLDGLVSYLNNRCRYAGYGNVMYERKRKNHVLTIEHGLGKKWSIYLEYTLNTALKKLGISAQIESNENTVTAKFRN